MAELCECEGRAFREPNTVTEHEKKQLFHWKGKKREKQQFLQQFGQKRPPLFSKPTPVANVPPHRTAAQPLSDSYKSCRSSLSSMLRVLWGTWMAVSVSCQGWSEEHSVVFTMFRHLWSAHLRCLRSKQQLERQHHAALTAGHPFQQHIGTSMVSLCAFVIVLFFFFFFYRDLWICSILFLLWRGKKRLTFAQYLFSGMRFIDLSSSKKSIKVL